MKKIMILFIGLFLSFGINAQQISGTWERMITAENGDQLKSVAIFADGYQAIATFNLTTQAFIDTKGGSWQINDGVLTTTIEFNSAEPEQVGTKVKATITLNENTFTLVESSEEWNKIDGGTPGKLQGTWLMSGRVRDGQTQLRDTGGPRKTMKILSGTRFQWIAYNTETKQFMGTGGGTYTTIGDAYTEHIEFFSRDDTRVGASLSFTYELIDGNWHHAGLSSKGDPIHEIWSKRK